MGHMATRTRLTPEQRREQLLDLGVRLLADRPIEELSVELLAEQAGVSRGLLYHYFGGLREFLHAVLRRMADELFEATAPVDHPDLVHRLRVSLQNYIGYVRAHQASYRSFQQAAFGGRPEIREIYEEGRAALVNRIFDSATADELAEVGIVDTPASRLLARGWSAMVEDVFMSWLDDPRDLSEEQVIETLTVSLGAILGLVPRD